MLLSALLLALPVPALATPGDLDPSFDGDGKVLTDFRTFEFVAAVVVQPDRKLVAAGVTYVGQVANVPPFAGFALARYNLDGSLDRSFGGDGRVRTRFRSFGDAAPASALVLQPDGKLVAAGLGFLGSTREFAFALARYNSDGNLDTSFGTGGLVFTNLGLGRFAGSAVVRLQSALVLQPDGKLVAAGPNGDFVLARYHPDGTLDTSFGTGGLVFTDFAGFDAASALVLQPDGKLVTAGESNGDFALARYHPDGNLDTSFGTGGLVLTVTDFRDSRQSALVLQPDGKLVVATGSNGDFALARYHPDGDLDTTFGTGGFVLTDFGGTESASALVLQPDGKLVTAGKLNDDFALARYNPNGNIDTSFGTGGVALTRFRGGSANANALSLSPDGKLLAAGFSNASGDGISHWRVILRQTSHSRCRPSAAGVRRRS